MSIEKPGLIHEIGSRVNSLDSLVSPLTGFLCQKLPAPLVYLLTTIEESVASIKSAWDMLTIILEDSDDTGQTAEHEVCCCLYIYIPQHR